MKEALSNKNNDIFDISEIPFIPYSPKLIAWISLFSFFLLALLLFLHLRKTSNKKSKYFKAFNEYKNELNKINEIYELDKLSKKTKRLLTLFVNKDLTTMSQNELLKYQESINSSEAREILEKLSIIEKIRFNKVSSKNINIKNLKADLLLKFENLFLGEKKK